MIGLVSMFRGLLCCIPTNIGSNQMRLFCMILTPLITSISVLTEKHPRVMEYTLFTLPRSVEGFFELFCKLGYLKPIPFGRQLLFALSVALVLMLNQNFELPHTHKRTIKFVYNEESKLDSDKLEINSNINTNST